ncbi:MAG: nitroreductase family deazaflavin-dependent oxidoreductase [Chloroflexota bacterium]
MGLDKPVVMDSAAEMNGTQADGFDLQPSEIELQVANWIPYPTGLVRLMARFPLVAYRLGLGNLLNSLHLMVLTTRGRKSGQHRHTPIEYRRHGRKIYVISAWGARPNWYQNILADSVVTVQLGDKTYSGRGHQVQDAAEALRALSLFRRIAPARYDAVLGHLIEAEVSGQTLPELSGQFTIVRLDLVTEAPRLAALAANLAWLWPVSLFAILSAGVLLSVAIRQRRSS